MLGTAEEFAQATKRLQGRRVRILGDHPFSGCSAYVVSLDKIGMKVRLIGGDAMDGHESYVMERKHYRPEHEGLDW